MGPLVATVFAAFAFWPQVGVLGQDLYFTNSVDLEPAAAATLDPWCGSRTYDTHTGDDVVIRSLREAAIGVPVFSVTDGTVSEVQDVKVRTGQQLGWSGSSGNSSWRYRYRWSAGGKVLRALTSAALSDVLVRDAAKPGQTLRCHVTPTDGKRPAKTASAVAQVPGAR